MGLIFNFLLVEMTMFKQGFWFYAMNLFVGLSGMAFFVMFTVIFWRINAHFTMFFKQLEDNSFPGTNNKIALLVFCTAGIANRSTVLLLVVDKNHEFISQSLFSSIETSLNQLLMATL